MTHSRLPRRRQVHYVLAGKGLSRSKYTLGCQSTPTAGFYSHTLANYRMQMLGNTMRDADWADPISWARSHWLGSSREVEHTARSLLNIV